MIDIHLLLFTSYADSIWVSNTKHIYNYVIESFGKGLLIVNLSNWTFPFKYDRQLIKTVNLVQRSQIGSISVFYLEKTLFKRSKIIYGTTVAFPYHSSCNQPMSDLWKHFYWRTSDPDCLISHLYWNNLYTMQVSEIRV